VIKKKAIALCATAGVALSVVAFVSPASAEPVSNSYTIVGSDTLQDVVNGLANGTSVSGANVRSLAAGATIGSFDATGSTLIQTKSNGVRFGRPNGSGDGVKALSRSIDGANYKAGTAGSPTVKIPGQVDIARSSSGPGTAQNGEGELLYIPFGRDALTYAHSGTAAFDTITAATLKGIFECTIRTIDGVTVTPVIPQAGSGTRKDFIAKINVTESSMLETTETGGCVVVGQEHDTQFLADGTTAFPANAVTPMSAAQWVAQNTGAGVNRIGASAKIGSPLAGVSPVTGTGTAMAPNAAFYGNSTWGRDTYLVVENARVETGNAKYDPALAALLNPSVPSSLANVAAITPSQAGSVKKKFGFLAPGSLTAIRANKTA
jgi:hypothetical protein